MKKLLKEVLFLAACMMLCFTSCSNGSDDPTIASLSGNISSNVSTIPGLKVNFSGAKALAATEAVVVTQSITQGADNDSESPLVKILEDGNFESAVSYDGNGHLAKIKSIYKSPSKDVYIIFDGNSWINGISFDRFICIHEDGKIADILKKSQKTNNSTYYSLDYNNQNIIFDGVGNAYFIVQEYTSGNSATLICKFNPTDNTVTELTAPVSGINYKKFLVTSDGQLIILSGSRYGTENSMPVGFLRSIPISDPNHFTNIYYSSNGGVVDWEYDDANGICYFSAGGLSMSVRKGNTFSEAKVIGSLVWWDSPIESKTKYENGNYTSYYVWKDSFVKSDGSVNASLVLQNMFNRCWTSGEKEFRLDYFQNHKTYSALYSELKDEEAINFIAADTGRMELFYKYIGDFSDQNIYRANALKNLIFKKGTDETAYREINVYESFAYGWNGFHFITSEGLWQCCTGTTNVNNTLYLVHVVDAKGYPIWEARKIALPNGKMVSSQMYNGNIYMSYALLTSSGAETGFHQIYSVNLDTGDYKNLFQNVPNNSMLEVISYSVGSDLLYYSAVRGTAVENGVVNVTSGEYNPLTIKKKLTAIYTF